MESFSLLTCTDSLIQVVVVVVSWSGESLDESGGGDYMQSKPS